MTARICAISPVAIASFLKCNVHQIQEEYNNVLTTGHPIKFVTNFENVKVCTKIQHFKTSSFSSVTSLFQIPFFLFWHHESNTSQFRNFLLYYFCFAAQFLNNPSISCICFGWHDLFTISHRHVFNHNSAHLSTCVLLKMVTFANISLADIMPTVLRTWCMTLILRMWIFLETFYTILFWVTQPIHRLHIVMCFKISKGKSATSEISTLSM